MTSPSVISVLVLLLIPEEGGVSAQAVTPGSPFPSDPYCDYWCILKGKQNGANAVDPYPFRCIELDPKDPDDQNPGTGCRSIWHKIFCPSDCIECDKQGQLWCPPLTPARANQPPPPPKSTNHDECLKKYCEDLSFLEGGVTLDSEKYTIKCGETYRVDDTICGAACHDCEGPLYQNPHCLKRVDNGFGLECPSLPRSLFPEGCSRFCGEEAWLRGMRTAADVRAPFTMSCGYHSSDNAGQRCGQDCPEECHGFCPWDGNLYCLAGVEPRERPTIRTTTTTTTTTQKAEAAATTGELGESKEENTWVMMLMIPFGVLSFCCSCALCGFRFYRSCNRGRRVGAVAGGLGLLQPQQQILQPQPMMAFPQQPQMGAPLPVEGAPVTQPAAEGL